MATQRVVSAEAGEASPGVADAAEQANWALRPTRMGEYVGQSELVRRLGITIRAVKERGDAMEHVLLHGPPGLGKTTLAHVIAAELGTRLYTTSGPALTRGSDLVGVLTRLDANDVLFIDEVHRVPVAVEEFIYPAMEDFRIDVPVESGMHARTVTLTLKPFTLIGATTRAGLVSAPLRSRFGITHSLRFYTDEELLEILVRSAGLLNVEATKDALREVAGRSRGTPRIANRLLRRVRDFAQVERDSRVTPDAVGAALTLEGVDERGLDELDRAYLRALAGTYGGGPVGLDALAATLNHDPGTLEDLVEPFLLQIGFLARTRRGRMLTKAAAEHLGVPPPASLSPSTLNEAEDDASALFGA